VKYVGGDPRIEFLDGSDAVTETINVSEMKTTEIVELMESKGFERHPPNEEL